MYGLETERTEYCGSAKLRREHFKGRPGLVGRIIGHWTWFHVKRGEGNKTRYKHARASCISSLTVAITYFGTLHEARGMEKFVTHAEKPRGDIKKRKKKVFLPEKPQREKGRRGVRKPRLRLGKLQREEKRAKLFDTQNHTVVSPYPAEAIQNTKEATSFTAKESQHALYAESKEKVKLTYDWTPPYGDVYDEMIRSDRKGRGGPVDLYSKKNKLLLMTYLAKTNTPLNWEYLEARWKVEVDGIALEQYVNRLGLPGRRRAATANINAGLREGGLPKGGPLTVRVESESEAREARRSMNLFFARVNCVSDTVREWIQRRTKVTVAPTRTVRAERNVVQASKEAEYDDCRNMQESDKKAAVEGIDMVRIPGTSQIPTRYDQKPAIQTRHKALRGWAASLKLPRRALMADLYAAKGVIGKDQKLESPQPREPQAYANFLIPSDDCPEARTLAPEDKSSGETWARYSPYYQYSLFRAAETAGWEHIPDKTLDEAEQDAKDFIIENLTPRWNFPKRQVLTAKHSVLPYLYQTFKGECDDIVNTVFEPNPEPNSTPTLCGLHHKSGNTAAAHTCVKDGHQCSHKIASFFYAPLKTIYTTMHRGLQISLATIPTWEVRSLEDAPETVKTQYGNLRAPELCKTNHFLCGCQKPPRGGLTSDGPQFYEKTPAIQARTSMDWCLNEVQRGTWLSTVTIIKGPKVRGHIGGAHPDNYVPMSAKNLVVGLKELQAFFDIAISLVICVVGDSIFRIPHVAIGPKVGKVAVSAVAGHREIYWSERCSRVSNLFIPNGYTLEQTVARMRYVDDQHLGGDTLCFLPRASWHHPPAAGPMAAAHQGSCSANRTTGPGNGSTDMGR